MAYKSISKIFDLLILRVYGNSGFQLNKNNENLTGTVSMSGETEYRDSR